MREKTVTANANSESGKIELAITVSETLVTGGTIGWRLMTAWIRAFGLLLACLVVSSLAAQELPSTIDVTTGRFDVLPAKYYEMRLERDLNGSDYDRVLESMVMLGQLDRASEALENVSSPDVRHFWSARIAAMHGDSEIAHKLYSQLLQVPSRYRGGVRLEIICVAKLGNSGLATYFDIPEIRERKQAGPNVLLQADLGGAVDWLKKQIVDGWFRENYSAHYTLSRLLAASGQHDEAILAWFRTLEIANASAASSGQPSLISGKARKNAESYLFLLNNGTDWKDHFQKLRGQADYWRAQRLSYLEESLKEGRHPDTDPIFWEKLSLQPLEDGPESSPTVRKPLFTPGRVLGMIGSILLFFAIIFLVYFVFWMRKRPGSGPNIDEL